MAFRSGWYEGPLGVFLFHPLGEHPVFLHCKVWKDLEKDWDKDEVGYYVLQWI